MQNLSITEYNNIRVLTTQQIAMAYETEGKIISNNFNRNRTRYIAGKHYVCLSGNEKKEFLNCHQIEDGLKNARLIYLWTEKGALLHAKSLNTDKAWEVYDYLVDFYFRVKEEKAAAVVEKKAEVVPVQPAKELGKKAEPPLPYIKNPIRIFSILLQVAAGVGIKVDSYPFKANFSMLKGGTIGIRTNSTVERACYELAWELSHALIHHDAGNIINGPLSEEYNRQADRAADLIIKVLNAG